MYPSSKSIRIRTKTMCQISKIAKVHLYRESLFFNHVKSNVIFAIKLVDTPRNTYPQSGTLTIYDFIQQRVPYLEKVVHKGCLRSGILLNKISLFEYFLKKTLFSLTSSLTMAMCVG